MPELVTVGPSTVRPVLVIMMAIAVFLPVVVLGIALIVSTDDGASGPTIEVVDGGDR
jgi:hypothetical protein